MTPHLVARLRIAALLVVVALVETALAPDMRIGGVAPDLMVLVVVCAGLYGGTEAGAWVGFFAGLLIDLFPASTPVGLSALTYTLVGAAVGAIRSSVIQESRLLLPAAGLVGTAIAVVAFVGVGDVLGQHQLLGAGRSWLIRVAVVESAWNALLSFPAGLIYSRLARGSVGVERLGQLGAASPAVAAR